MDPTDESRRKPRRTKGTPSFYYRNRFAYALIGAGAALFAVWSYTPIFHIANEKIAKSIYKPTEEELDRRYLFSLGAPRTSRDIQASIDDKNQMISDR